MNLKAFFLVIAFCVANADFPDVEITAYDYHRKLGIPTAKRLRRAEEFNLILDASGIPTIVGGGYTDIAEVPYQVGLVISLFFLLTSVCGGSLISNTRVLTAAHCHSDGILKANSFTVVLGSNKLFFGGLRIDTSDASVHPDWNPMKLENDLCILRIPVVAFTHSTIRKNQCLSSVRLNVISNDECVDTFGSLIRDGNICTSGEKGQSTCRGDSGGPLVVYVNHYRVLIGVTSFGARASCQAGFPAAYSRVTYFIPWITSQ